MTYMENEPHINDALDKALRVLGENGKKITLTQLDKRMGVLDYNRELSLAEIEAGLHDLFGYGSELLVRKLKQELASG